MDYQYALPQNNIFTEEVEVYNVYCIGISSSKGAIFYTTSKGNFYLYASGEDIYLLPQDKMFELETKHREYLDNPEQDIYGEQSPIDRLTDEEKEVYFMGCLNPVDRHVDKVKPELLS